MNSTDAAELDHHPSLRDTDRPGRALARLYLGRAVAALIWAVAMLVLALDPGVVLTALLVAYPLLDVIAVGLQLRSDRRGPGSALSEQINIGVSAVVAVALGIAANVSVPAVLLVWGVWAIGAGLPQLLTAIRRRAAGGQVPQMLSGGISVLAGASFLVQGLSGEGALAGIAGYAILGAVFFVASALRLQRRHRPEVPPLTHA